MFSTILSTTSSVAADKPGAFVTQVVGWLVVLGVSAALIFYGLRGAAGAARPRGDRK